MHMHGFESITIIIKIPANTNNLTLNRITHFIKNQVTFLFFYSQFFNKIALTIS
jgi:hypothetical protein